MRHFAIDTGPYADGVIRKLDEAAASQSAWPDLPPVRPLSRVQGGLGSDRRHDSIENLAALNRFPAPPSACHVKADGCLLTLKRGANT